VLAFLAEWPGSVEDDFLHKMVESYHTNPDGIPGRIRAEVNDIPEDSVSSCCRDMLHKYEKPVQFETFKFDDKAWAAHVKDIMQGNFRDPSCYQHILDNGYHGLKYNYKEGEPVFQEWEKFAAMLVRLYRRANGHTRSTL